MENKKWTYTNQEGVTEDVALENWIWGVVYEDGTELHQFDDNGIFHRVGEIDQKRVVMWVLYQPKGKGDGRIDFIIPREDVPEDAPEGTIGALKEVALIHKYKNVVLNAASPQESRHRVVVFGFKIRGQRSVYNYIMPSGTIIQSVEANPQLSQFVQK